MAKKLMMWKTKGMNQDLSVSAFNPEFSFENINLRLSTNEGNTLMSWVSEKGTRQLQLKAEGGNNISLSGTPIGTAIINNKLVIFTTTYTDESPMTTGNHDYIYVAEYIDDDKTTMRITTLYNGNLNFSTKYPLETLVSYESTLVQKVYWVDGRNQPRLINIMAENINNKLPLFFDFSPTLQLQEIVTVEKKYDDIGMFAPGVILYAFTYYNKYGQESNIFYTTPLLYISYRERGGSPEDKINNSFKITIKNVDPNFEYLRIYSIQRTSLDAVPFCRRIRDLEIAGMEKDSSGKRYTSYIDTGTNGDTIDPTELLYIGGEVISAETLELKDNTLFFGNINISRKPLPDNIKSLLEAEFKPRDTSINVENDINTAHAKMTSVLSTFLGTAVYSGDIPYVNTIDHSGFKWREVYRIGIQFQHETGKWSDPVWLRDIRIKQLPTNIDSWIYGNGNTLPPTDAVVTDKVKLPEIQVLLIDSRNNGIYSTLHKNNYKRARLLMALPTISGRTILCLGIANLTIFSLMKRYGRAADDTTSEISETLYGLSSWIFRPIEKIGEYYEGLELSDTTAPGGGGYVPSRGGKEVFDTETYVGLVANVFGTRTFYNSPYLNSTEIGAVLKDDDKFKIDECLFTIHSPELIFDETLYSEDWKSAEVCMFGDAMFQNTFGDIDILTKTPTIGSAAGFIHRATKTPGNAALISGLLYEDFIVDDLNDTPKYGRYPDMHVPVMWPVTMWHHTGSLNNDVNRDTRSAELTKKKISNYHVSKFNMCENYSSSAVGYKMMEDTSDIQLFNNDELSVIKVDGHTYMGNIDISIPPKEPQHKYFAGNPWREHIEDDDEEHRTKLFWKLGLADPGDTNSRNGFWKFLEADLLTGTITWRNEDGEWKHIGDYVADLCETSEPIRMKYKSTPHLVCKSSRATSVTNPYVNSLFGTNYNRVSGLPIVDIVKTYNRTTFYGGLSEEALRANTWIPISDPIDISTNMTLTSQWGDTYYQRFDCMKTYPFTNEDVNQVIDIASFMVETHINIDGRYDRNRGLASNLNMHPGNFNLLNPVYSQQNNFFNYRIMDSDYYKDTSYPNQIMWSRTKTSDAEIDLWTNIIPTSVLEMDGDKGSVRKLIRFNDLLLCFQDKGISQILYNDNVQISSTEGVPIEIANSGKVQGKRYFSDSVGCSNKWSMTLTPSGIYFMDSINKAIFIFNGQPNNLSGSLGFNTWSKKNIPSIEVKWTPIEFWNFVSYYDKLNQDILFINKKVALAFSEKLGAFTSFYNYGETPYFCNLQDTGIWIRNPYKETINGSTYPIALWRHNAGDYCKFFGINLPYSMTLIGNPEPLTDKIFTNLEFRACVDGDGKIETKTVVDPDTLEETVVETGKFIPALPFDSLESWNEYQHGYTTLETKSGHNLFKHGGDSSALNRKFRIWRNDIPRNNCLLDAAHRDWDNIDGMTPLAYSYDTDLGISRHIRKPTDRMRNPWIYLKLAKKAEEDNLKSLPKVEVHDLIMTYYN